MRAAGLAVLSLLGLPGFISPLSASPPLVLTGAVMDRLGAPIHGALVRAVPLERPHSPSFQRTAPSARVQLAGDNRFRLKGLTRGKVYVIEATAPGFAPTRVEIPPLTAERRVYLALLPGRTGAGRVLDPQERPVAGAEIVLIASPGRLPLSRESSEGDLGLDVWRATTDADGHFQVTGLPQAPLTLRVRKAGFAALGVRGVEMNPEGSLGLWKLARGNSREIPVALAPAPDLPINRAISSGHEIIGKVSVPHSGVAGGALITVTRGGRFPSFEAVTEEDGTFRVTVDSKGTYTLLAQKEGWADTRMPGLRVQGAPLKGLNVRMGPGALLTGHLNGLDLDDLAEVEITAYPHDRLQIAGRVDAHGLYEIADLSPGKWTVEARLRGRPWIKVRITIRPEAAGGDPVVLDLGTDPP